MLLVALAASTSQASPAWTYMTGNYVWSVAVSEDGAYAIAGSDDMHAYFFDTRSADAKPLWSYGTQGYVRHVAISGNGSRAAASDVAGGIFFFERPELSDAPDWVFRSDYPIDALVLSGDGDYLAAGDRRGNVYVFETSRTDPLIWQSSIPGGVLALSLSESRALAATGTKGGLYFFGASPSTSYQWSFNEHTNVPCLAFVDDLEQIVAAGGDGSLYLIDTSGQLLDEYELGGALSALSISARTRRVVTGSTNGDVSVLHVDGRLEEVATVGTKNPVTSTTLSDDGERIAVANTNGTISMFDGSLVNRIWTFEAGAIVHSLSMSADGSILVAGSDSGAVYLFSEQGSAISGMMASYVVVAALIVMAVVILLVIWQKKRS